jgi:uncharacterized RDD family membrane protein YckC
MVRVLARRIGAAFIDSIVAPLLIAIPMAIGAAIAPRAFFYRSFYGTTKPTTFTIVLFFALYIAYFILFEIAWNGQTPGKRVLDLRVATVANTLATPRSIIIRNVIRPIDGLFNYLVGFIAIVASSNNQRIGDIVADTTVIYTAETRDVTIQHDSTHTMRADSDAEPDAEGPRPRR